MGVKGEGEGKESHKLNERTRMIRSSGWLWRRFQSCSRSWNAGGQIPHHGYQRLGKVEEIECL